MFFSSASLQYFSWCMGIRPHDSAKSCAGAGAPIHFKTLCLLLFITEVFRDVKMVSNGFSFVFLAFQYIFHLSYRFRSGLSSPSSSYTSGRSSFSSKPLLSRKKRPSRPMRPPIIFQGTAQVYRSLLRIRSQILCWNRSHAP